MPTGGASSHARSAPVWVTTPALSSAEPRPYRRPSRSTGSNGSVSHSVDRAGRLHVVVGVQQDGRGARRCGPGAQHGGMGAFDLQQPGLEAAGTQESPPPLPPIAGRGTGRTRRRSPTGCRTRSSSSDRTSGSARATAARMRSASVMRSDGGPVRGVHDLADRDAVEPRALHDLGQHPGRTRPRDFGHHHVQARVRDAHAAGRVRIRGRRRRRPSASAARPGGTRPTADATKSLGESVRPEKSGGWLTSTRGRDVAACASGRRAVRTTRCARPGSSSRRGCGASPRRPRTPRCPGSRAVPVPNGPGSVRPRNPPGRGATSAACALPTSAGSRRARGRCGSRRAGMVTLRTGSGGSRVRRRSAT